MKWTALHGGKDRATRKRRQSRKEDGRERRGKGLMLQGVEGTAVKKKGNRTEQSGGWAPRRI